MILEKEQKNIKFKDFDFAIVKNNDISILNQGWLLFETELFN